MRRRKKEERRKEKRERRKDKEARIKNSEKNNKDNYDSKSYRRSHFYALSKFLPDVAWSGMQTCRRCLCIAEGGHPPGILAGYIK